MQVTAFGSEYVGLVTSACLVEVSNNVLCRDVHESKIKNFKDSVISIYARPGYIGFGKPGSRAIKVYIGFERGNQYYYRSLNWLGL